MDRNEFLRIFCGKITKEAKRRFLRLLPALCTDINISFGYLQTVAGADLENEQTFTDAAFVACCAIVDKAIQDLIADSKEGGQQGIDASVYETIQQLLSGEEQCDGVFLASPQKGDLLSYALSCYEYIKLEGDEETAEFLSDRLVSHCVVIPTMSFFLAEGADEAVSRIVTHLELTNRKMLLPLRISDKLLAYRFECEKDEFDRLSDLYKTIAFAQRRGLIDLRGDDADPYEERELVDEVLRRLTPERAVVVLCQEPEAAEKYHAVCPDRIICASVMSDGSLDVLCGPEEAEDEDKDDAGEAFAPDEYDEEDESEEDADEYDDEYDEYDEEEDEYDEGEDESEEDAGEYEVEEHDSDLTRIFRQPPDHPSANQDFYDEFLHTLFPDQSEE